MDPTEVVGYVVLQRGSIANETVYCAKCGDLLSCGLTSDGRQYVAEALAYSSTGPAIVQWMDRWPDLKPKRRAV